jgi:hypothetical protein
VRDGKLNINASFHPTMAKKEEFLKQLLVLREHGIEAPIIYVMYPPVFHKFKEFFEYFSKEGFLFHVRRYEGEFQGKYYPRDYKEEELLTIAAYEDDATIKYMLNDMPAFGEKTYGGMYYIIVDNVGNIGWNSDYHPHYSIDRCRFGNILQNNIRLLWEPMPMPAHTPFGTVDGVANIVSLNYRELEGNHIASYMKQGGIYREGGNVIYKNLNVDFKNPKIRAKYNFPARNLQERIAKFRHFGIKKSVNKKIESLCHRVYHKLLKTRHGWMFSE